MTELKPSRTTSVMLTATAHAQIKMGVGGPFTGGSAGIGISARPRQISRGKVINRNRSIGIISLDINRWRVDSALDWTYVEPLMREAT